MENELGCCGPRYEPDSGQRAEVRQTYAASMSNCETLVQAIHSLDAVSTKIFNVGMLPGHTLLRAGSLADFRGQWTMNKMGVIPRKRIS